MKFNRLELIETVRKHITDEEEQYVHDSELWQEAMATWEAHTIKTQQTKLSKIIIDLNALVGLDRLLTNKDLAVVRDGSSYRDSELDDLVESRPNRLALGDSQVERTAPRPYDKRLDECLIALLELCKDDFVTTNGLSEMGFRDLKWLWS